MLYRRFRSPFPFLFFGRSSFTITVSILVFSVTVTVLVFYGPLSVVLFVISLYRILCHVMYLFIILVSTYVIYAFEEFKWIVFISTRRGVVFSVATNFA